MPIDLRKSVPHSFCLFSDEITRSFNGCFDHSLNKCLKRFSFFPLPCLYFSLLSFDIFYRPTLFVSPIWFAFINLKQDKSESSQYSTNELFEWIKSKYHTTNTNNLSSVLILYVLITFQVDYKMHLHIR